MIISIVAAMAKNRVIGNGSEIPWKVKGDQKRFKELTTGHSIIMGRNTWDSIGFPLPNRRSIVLSRIPSGLFIDGADVVDSLEEAIELCEGEDEVFIIGGGQIYAEAMDIADKIYLTVMDLEPEGDVFFPKIPYGIFNLIEEISHPGEIDSYTNIYERN